MLKIFVNFWPLPPLLEALDRVFGGHIIPLSQFWRKAPWDWRKGRNLNQEKNMKVVLKKDNDGEEEDDEDEGGEGEEEY